jgi:hypothetical protein
MVHTTTVGLQNKYCKGTCEHLKNNAPYGDRYKDHVYCTRCEMWMLQEAMMGNGKCPCCHYRPRYKSKYNKGRIKAQRIEKRI